jgi:3-deoxy-manno-octulosonate cytidylyltransferase (CMP-KDO synthetase)
MRVGERGDASGESPRAVVVIPARFGSTRLPGKPLLAETGKPLIQHVYEQVAKARGLADVIVATDDERIRAAVEGFGGRAVLTSPAHTCGTERVAEVARGLRADIIVNVQGDEPELPPADLEGLVRLLAGEGEAPMATLAFPSEDPEVYRSPSVVKVVVDERGYALYFSRSPVPFYRDARPGTPRFLKHLGVYAYRREFLLEFTGLPPTPLEQAERLEQLRALEHGYRIRVGWASRDSLGIDTPEEYRTFVARTVGRSAGAGKTGGD